MQKISTLLALLIACCTTALGQNFPLYSQYIFDPYLINPSLVGNSRRSEVNLLYRQQWSGIKDGPRTIQFDIQHPIDKKMTLGLNIYNDKTVLLSNTSVMATFGYKVQLMTGHALGFGISAGVFSNRIRIEEVPDVDINDPVLLKAVQNNFVFDGQFGVNYSHKNFILGFSVLRLVNNRPFADEQFQKITVNQLKNKVAFATYRFNLSENIGLQPSVAYHLTSDNQDYYNVGLFLSYREIFDIGGGYRQDYGPNAMVRLKWKDLQIGYAYDLPSTHANVSTGGTNEVQIKWRFGKLVDPVTIARQKPKKTLHLTEEDTAIIAAVIEKIEEKKLAEKAKAEEEKAKKEMEAPVIKPTTQPATIPTQVPEGQAPPANVPATDKNTVPETKQETKTEPENNETEPAHERIVGTKYYLIVGSFEKHANAEKLMRAMIRNGLKAQIRKSSEGDLYYVYLPEYTTDEITLERILELRKDPKFKDAWFKQLE